MNALQFEAEWERIHADLEEVGLGKNKLEKFLNYITKIGPPLSDTIRLDRRPRSDGAGGMTTRPCETWEECHAVAGRHKSWIARIFVRQSRRSNRDSTDNL